jgi:hypothetical protein
MQANVVIESRLLPALVLIAAIGMTISAVAQEPTRQFPQACAVKDVAVVTLIEDHGAAGDLSADRLGKAGQTMLDARMVCRAGRVGEALGLYQSILDLGPVASLRRQ